MKLSLPVLTMAFAAIAAVAAPGLIHAADVKKPAQLQAEESIVIDAPAAKVWAVVGDFNGLPKWIPPVEASSATKGNKVGSVRTLSITGGEKLIEVLEGYDKKAMRLRYRFRESNLKVLPVNNYHSIIQVMAQGANASKVTWKGTFVRGAMDAEPPAEMNDEAAVKAVTGLYKVSLEKLKKVVEDK